MHEKRRDTEHEKAGQQLQVRVPHGRLEWVFVQDGVDVVLDETPAEGVRGARSRVEDLHFAGSETGPYFKSTHVTDSPADEITAVPSP